MQQALMFLGILSLVVLIHELGHYLAAKMFGVRVDEFGFGLPPRAFKLFRKWGTDFTVNWLPTGGFVKLYGENGESELGVSDERAFWSKRLWQRGIILVSGVVMNFILGVVLFSVVYSVLGIPSKIDGVKITDITKDSPAASAGLMTGDVIKEIQIADVRSKILGTEEFLKLVGENKGREVTLVVEREEKTKEFKLTPRADPPPGEGAIGIVITDSELKHYPWYETPFRGIWVGLNEAWVWGREIVSGLWTMVYGLITGKGISRDLAGPVGIYKLSGEVSKLGWLPLVQFVGVLSVNLAILNIMPFPALDGGRLIFLVLELIRGRRVREDIEGWVNTIGMIVLLALMALITANDLLKLIGR